MEPTKEQELICSRASGKQHLQIVAFAGTGKTATLRMLAERIKDPKLYVAFNKRIIEEALDGFPGEAKTINAIGHRAWMKTIPGKVIVDGKKTYTIFKEVVKAHKGEDANELWDSYGEIGEAVGLAKARGYIPRGANRWSRRLVDEDFFLGTGCGSTLQRKIVDQILEASIKQAYAGNIDFDDQPYMSVLFGGSFPRYPTVFVDEEQDLNEVNQLMVDKLIKGGRLISVGDPFQSIYRFRGAMQGGMGVQKDRRQMETATLSVSFRCPSKIVENARWRVPGFQWFKAGGHVELLRELALGHIQENSAIICRNNAPLFKLALRLLSGGRPCRVAGSDIGPKLVNTLKRLGDAGMGRSSVLSAIDTWAEKKEGRGDMAECLRVFANSTDNLQDAIRLAEFVLRQDGPITLITGHKAKGLEWDTVYHLDPWLIGMRDPSDEQELNLRYVIQTRAKEAYYEVDSQSIV